MNDNVEAFLNIDFFNKKHTIDWINECESGSGDGYGGGNGFGFESGSGYGSSEGYGYGFGNGYGNGYG